MLIKCHKIISPIMKKDLGDKSPWLKKGNIYLVLALDYSTLFGLHAYIQTEHYHEPRFTPLIGFEIISQHIPSTWITVVKEYENKKLVTMLPRNWSYNSFFEDISEELPEAVDLFHAEAKIIYEEEGWYFN